MAAHAESLDEKTDELASEASILVSIGDEEQAFPKEQLLKIQYFQMLFSETWRRPEETVSIGEKSHLNFNMELFVAFVDYVSHGELSQAVHIGNAEKFLSCVSFMTISTPDPVLEDEVIRACELTCRYSEWDHYIRRFAESRHAVLRSWAEEQHIFLSQTAQEMILCRFFKSGGTGNVAIVSKITQTIRPFHVATALDCLLDEWIVDEEAGTCVLPSRSVWRSVAPFLMGHPEEDWELLSNNDCLESVVSKCLALDLRVRNLSKNHCVMHANASEEMQSQFCEFCQLVMLRIIVRRSPLCPIRQNIETHFGRLILRKDRYGRFAAVIGFTLRRPQEHHDEIAVRCLDNMSVMYAMPLIEKCALVIMDGSCSQIVGPVFTSMILSRIRLENENGEDLCR